MSSSGFTTLDEYLATPFPVDHWEDDAIAYAQELVRRLTPQEWVVFEGAWPQRPVKWQARAAQVLSHGATANAVPILIGMTESADPDVVEAALDSLREFGSPKALLAVPAALVERLDRLAAERPGPVAKVLADLRRRVHVI